MHPLMNGKTKNILSVKYVPEYVFRYKNYAFRRTYKHFDRNRINCENGNFFHVPNALNIDFQTAFINNSALDIKISRSIPPLLW